MIFTYCNIYPNKLSKITYIENKSVLQALVTVSNTSQPSHHDDMESEKHSDIGDIKICII